MARIYNCIEDSVSQESWSDRKILDKSCLPTNAPEDPFNLLKLTTIGPTVVMQTKNPRVFRLFFHDLWFLRKLKSVN